MKTIYIYFNSLTLEVGMTEDKKMWITSAHSPLCKIESEDQAEMLISGIWNYKKAVLQKALFPIEDKLKELIKQGKAL